MRCELRPPLLFSAHCHCDSCRRSHAAPFVTWTAVPHDRFRLTSGEDALRSYRGSSHARRSFCGVCGTPMIYVSREWPGKTYVPVAVLVDPPAEAVAPQCHVHAAEAVSWCTLADGLPRHEGFDEPTPA